MPDEVVNIDTLSVSEATHQPEEFPPGTRELIQFKRDCIDLAMPAESALVCGDIYVVEGYYTRYCLEKGCATSTLIDMIETPKFNSFRANDSRIRFHKGNFADPIFMRSLQVQAEVGVLFDVMLHQASANQALYEICRHVTRRLCIVQPTIEEMDYPQGMVFLPGNSAPGLAPTEGVDPRRKVFEARNTNPAHWMWAITRSALVAMVECQGFEITEERRLVGVEIVAPWYNLGIVAERSNKPIVHWGDNHPAGEILTPWW